MFSDTAFWRLTWKEYRTQRPLWLTLLIGTLMMQVAFLALNWAIDGFLPLVLTEGLKLGLLGIAYAASAIYVLGCGATLFSVEHETNTFDFQRVLPANQARVFWAKVGFALVSSLSLTLLLWIITRGVFVLTLPREGTGYGGFGLLFLVELFLWSILCSLLIRQPLWSVVTAITVQSAMLFFVVPFLRGPMHDSDWPGSSAGYLPVRIGIALAICVAEIVLGKLWFEDRLRPPRWRLSWKPDFVPSYASDIELPTYVGQRQIGWSRLLWMGWRDARWIVAGMFIWLACCWRTTPNGDERLVLMLTYFIGSFVFGLFAFVSEQWGDRYRFCTERGCSPRVVWLCRHVVWLSPVLLMSVAVFWLCSRNPNVFSSNPAQEQFEWASVVWGPLVCYSAGQLAAMLLRSTAVAFATGMGLTFLGIIWSLLMTSWLAPTWWAVGSLPVIGLFVTWLRANDWIEERRDRVARWRLVLGIGVPGILLLAACATYRVVQIPVVTLPAEWGEDGEPKKLTAAETETLDLYRRALAEIETGNKRVSSYDSRVTRIRHEHADWSDAQVHTAAFNGFHKDWLAEHSGVVPLLREAHSRAAVPLALLQPDLASFSDEIWMPDKAAEFSLLMVRHARQLLEAGQLDEAWQEIEVTWELLRRYWQRAAPVHMMSQVAPNESMLWDVIADWGRHPDQSKSRIVSAIHRLEQLAGGCEAARHQIHLRLMSAQLSLFSDQQRRQDIHILLFVSRGGIESSWLWNAWRIQPWEWWRTERVLRWRASLVVAHVQAVRRQCDANQPIVLGNWSRMGTWDPVGQVLCETTVIPPNITWGMQVEAERIVLDQAATFRATMLQLALVDWHREHGSYPESLSQLARSYFTVIPFDPRVAGPFVYFPHGVPDNVNQGSDNQGRVILEKGIPFLMTMGAGNAIAGSRQLPDGSWAFWDRSGKPISLSEALRSARVWPLHKTSASNE